MRLRIGRVKIEISFAFAVLLALILGCSDGAGFGISFLCCCIHEALHLLLFALSGAYPKSISLGAAGMRMDFGGCIPVSFVREAVACAVPPVINTVLGGIFAYLYSRGNPVFLIPAAANIVLGAVNLLPVRALDGGRALWCLTASFFSPSAADTVLGVSEALTVPVLVLAALRSLIINPGNFSVPVLCVYVLILTLGKKYRL